MDEKDEELLQSLKANPRYSELKLKLAKGTSALNLEEMSTLSLVQQIENRAENRAHAKTIMDLTEKTVKLSGDSVAMAKKLACWTMLLAIATFALAVAAFLNLALM